MSERVRRSWPWRRHPADDELEVEAAAAQETTPALPNVLLEGSALRERYAVSAAPTFMFISLFGMTEEAIAERADLVDDELRRKSVVPVYLVDAPAFAPLRAERRLFEYLPAHGRAALRSPELEWPYYLRRRYLLLQAKWQPIGRIDFGDIPDWLPDHAQDTQPA